MRPEFQARAGGKRPGAWPVGAGLCSQRKHYNMSHCSWNDDSARKLVASDLLAPGSRHTGLCVGGRRPRAPRLRFRNLAMPDSVSPCFRSGSLEANPEMKICVCQSFIEVESQGFLHGRRRGRVGAGLCGQFPDSDTGVGLPGCHPQAPFGFGVCGLLAVGPWRSSHSVHSHPTGTRGVLSLDFGLVAFPAWVSPF